MKRLMLTAAAVLAPLLVLAAPGDKALQFHMQQSELVVAGKIVSDVGVHRKGLGYRIYTFTFQVSDVLHGSLSGGKELNIVLNRRELENGDALPFLKKNAKCVLFLNEKDHTDGNVWGAADPWFGIQSYNSIMAKRIKELAKQKKK